MSEDEKDAILGKAMRRYVSEKREVALLSDKIKSVGQALGSLGRLLQDEIPTKSALENNPYFQMSKSSTFVGYAQISSLLDEFHARSKELVNMRKQLAELGILDPEALK
jgi:hypothetical protein